MQPCRSCLGTAKQANYCYKHIWVAHKPRIWGEYRPEPHDLTKSRSHKPPSWAGQRRSCIRVSIAQPYQARCVAGVQALGFARPQTPARGLSREVGPNGPNGRLS